MKVSSATEDGLKFDVMYFLRQSIFFMETINKKLKSGST